MFFAKMDSNLILSWVTCKNDSSVLYSHVAAAVSKFVRNCRFRFFLVCNAKVLLAEKR